MGFVFQVFLMVSDSFDIAKKLGTMVQSFVAIIAEKMMISLCKISKSKKFEQQSQDLGSWGGAGGGLFYF